MLLFYTSRMQQQQQQLGGLLPHHNPHTSVLYNHILPEAPPRSFLRENESRPCIIVATYLGVNIRLFPRTGFCTYEV